MVAVSGLCVSGPWQPVGGPTALVFDSLVETSKD